MSMTVELVTITPNAVKMIEDIAGICWDSISPVTPGNRVKHIIKMGHESVLEHGVATFKINGVSRALTHQLVRHRIASFTQRSQRYVDEGTFEFVVPTSISGSPQASAIYFEFMESCNNTYKKLRDLGCLKEDARFVLPNACVSEIAMTANFREWRNVLKLRCDKHAQWEIRDLATQILKILKHEVPFVFDDLYEQYVAKGE